MLEESLIFDSFSYVNKNECCPSSLKLESQQASMAFRITATNMGMGMQVCFLDMLQKRMEPIL